MDSKDAIHWEAVNEGVDSSIVNGVQDFLQVSRFPSSVGKMFYVADVFQECSLDALGSQFRSNLVAAGIISALCSFTGIIWTSLYRYSAEDIKKHPIIVRSTVF